MKTVAPRHVPASTVYVLYVLCKWFLSSVADSNKQVSIVYVSTVVSTVLDGHFIEVLDRTITDVIAGRFCNDHQDIQIMSETVHSLINAL